MTMNTRAWYASLVTKPDIITGPGQYVTRSGETVTITAASTRQDFRCVGHYSNGIREGWHKSGRLYFGMESANDIVRAA